MTHLKRKLMMTLVALLALTTHAWADEQSESFTTKGSYQLVFTGEHFTITGTMNDGSDGLDLEDENTITIQSNNNENITHVALTFNWGFRYFGKGVADPGTIEYTYANSDEGVASIKDINSTILTISSTVNDGMIQISQITVYYGDLASSATPVPLTWDAATPNTATLTNGMPAGNVTVSVEYFPQATMADGAVTAATDVKATTEDALVTIDKNKLTGVAKLMYFVSTDAEATAPAYTATGWTDVLPTAANYTEAGDVKVWYYAVGTNEGVGEATATYSDGDICAAPLTVTLAAAPLWNAEFDLTNAPEADQTGKWSTDIPEGGVKKGTPVTVTYTGTKKVIGVKAEKKEPIIDLSTLTEGYEAQNGDVLIGTLNGAQKITIASGATVTLAGVTINGVHSDRYQYAGITCLGDATIILKDGTTNTVTGFDGAFPGIKGAAGKTLTITGTGSLYASCDANGSGAGIGSASYSNNNTERACGNIVIEGGTITAVGGYSGAGIGSGSNASCGNITIKSTVAHVTATKGKVAYDSIGAGKGGSCGTKTIEDASKVTQN